MMGVTTMPAKAVTPEPKRHPAALRRITGDVRVRILASYVLLLAVAAVASVLVVRQVLLVRLEDRIEEDLAQEVQEFRNLAGGVDPASGRPFGSDADRIFSVYLDRNVPGEGEQLLTIPRRGQPQYKATERANLLPEPSLVSRWRDLRRTERGEIETVAGEARYIALPLLDDNRNVGTFVVAHFTEGEREEVDEAVRIVALVAAGILVLGTAFAFAVSGRVLSPVRDLRDAARSVSGSNLRSRIEVDGDDELADLGQSFNEMLERLESAFSTQRNFIRDISHELRTPIAVVRGHIELMSEGVSDPAERAATMTLIAGELDRMSRFVNDLLLLAKSEQPDFLQLETVPLDELCEELEQNGRALAADRQWRVEAGVATLGRRRPPADHPGDDEPDPKRRRAHGRGRRDPDRHPSRRPARDAPGARLGRRDPQGRAEPGLRPFRPRRRQQAPLRGQRARTGDRPGDRPSPRRLRRADVEPGQGRRVSRRRPRGGPRFALRPGESVAMKRILIAEDEAGMASFLEKGLASRGYAVKVVADGSGATAIASDEDFDLLILDLGLPDVDGLSVLRELRRRGEKMPVLILTARDDLTDKIEGLDAGRGGLRDEAVQARRSCWLVCACSCARARSAEPTVLEAGGVTLDIRTRKAMIDGEAVDLTAREFTMLETFMAHPGQVLQPGAAPGPGLGL